jgi:hypothetical protein
MCVLSQYYACTVQAYNYKWNATRSGTPPRIRIEGVDRTTVMKDGKKVMLRVLMDDLAIPSKQEIERNMKAAAAAQREHDIQMGIVPAQEVSLTG